MSGNQGTNKKVNVPLSRVISFLNPKALNPIYILYIYIYTCVYIYIYLYLYLYMGSG